MNLHHLLLLLIITQSLVTCEKVAPGSTGYMKMPGVYCPVENPDSSGDAFPGSFASCIKACSGNATCVGFNFELAAKPGEISTCQMVKTPCKKNQLQPAGVDKVYYSKGERSCLRNNAGNEFVFAFMANRPQQPRRMNLEIYVAHNNPNVNVQIALETGLNPAISANRDNDSAEFISLPIQGKSAYPTLETFKTKKLVQENTPQVFELSPVWKLSDLVKGKAPKLGAAVVEKKAIRVFSEDGSKFFAVGSNKEHFTGDAFLGLPVSSLGRRYFAACYSPPFYACEFAVATGDFTGSTLVNITLPLNDSVRLGPDAAKPKAKACKVQLPDGSIYTNGETFSVFLAPYDVIQVQDPCDLTGTLIESSRPVAVFSGNVRTNVGEGTDSRDHLVEQLLPSSTWGIDCAGAATPGRSVGDYWSVTAASPKTIVEIFTGESIKDVVELDNPGDSFRFKAKSYTNIFFKANKPIQVISYVHSQMLPEEQADPSMTVCTSSAQFDYGYTFVTPTEVGTLYRSFMTIVIDDGYQNVLQLDGRQLIAAHWNPVPNTSMVTTAVELPPTGVHTISQADKAVRFAAYIYGAGDRASFAFPLGTCANELTCEPSESKVGDGVDNDCDTMIDEEICDGTDDDNDGRIDEDCYASKRVANNERVEATQAEQAPAESGDQCLDVRSAVGCYNAKIVLQCDGSTSDMRIKVLSAHFGRTGYRDEFTCSAGNPVGLDGREINCGLRDVYWPIAQACDNTSLCAYHVHLYELGDITPYNQRCQLCVQYAVVQYVCVSPSAIERMTLAGRVGAESSSRYWASSWAYGSAPLPFVGLSDCNQGSINYGGTVSQSSRQQHQSLSSCYRAPDELDDSARRIWTTDTTGPASARFSTSATQAWCPAFCDRQDGWLIIDLGGHYEVTGYMLQGRRAEEQWVTSIRLAYSADAVKWTELRYNNGTWMYFPGNFDARSIVACDLSQLGIIARFMRTFVGTYSGQPCLHIDFFRKNQQMGCPPKTIQNSNTVEEPGRRGTTLTVECRRGWRTADGETSYTIKCGATSGQWEGDARPCSELVSCTDIPLVDGALHNGQHTRVGSRVDYTCTGGRHLIGNSTVFCVADGTWTPRPPRCTF